MIWDRCGHGDGPRLLTPVERRDLWSLSAGALVLHLASADGSFL
jgi:hypothetical protein